ncbi:GH39 family glycosyl hydrolase [Pedobacter rhizosphaerae]|uniref:Xylan 1,4-beta-xylosidase n=1 Tax=Pedobacter rhizosphaerae TaxID=390241 RepID=A0A1H9VR14_9SPHI|nr:beta-xylosidase [Pedobacter rhizosphaerae]SES23998.1 xylan 1,4-beta-xylosidase [Pedobacter rhizosphaerae]
MISNKRIQYILIFFLSVMVLPDSFAQDNRPNPAQVTVDFSRPVGQMSPVWSWFGYDEPNYTYMKDGKKLLSELSMLSEVPVYVRTHNLLTTGNGQPALKWGSTNAYTEDAKGNPIYNWTIIDQIFDSYVQRGMKPLAQIGFMPEAMSIKPTPYQHDWKPGDPFRKLITGWAYPPKDYHKWAELIFQWVNHSVVRYGKKEVESWYWQLWNEPSGYWRGTMEEYFKLYDYTADAVKRALPTAKIGGLNIAQTRKEGSRKWMKAFLQHCQNGTNYATGEKGAPLDLFLFHAKGEPRLKNGMVEMDMSTQLQDISSGFEMLSSFPEFKNISIVIGESDPEGCAACGIATDPQNAYRNGTMFSSYTAASFARKYLLADQYGINFLGAVSWSFEFENQPWFAGLRDLSTNGVDKPVLNVFRMFGKMSGQRVWVDASRMRSLSNVVDSSVRTGTTEIGALASKDDKSAGIMLWNYHDLDIPGVAEKVKVHLKGIKVKRMTVTSYLIDSKHSNSYALWKKMGSPQNPSTAQIRLLQKTGQLAQSATPKTMNLRNGQLEIEIDLERQAVALLHFKW